VNYRPELLRRDDSYDGRYVRGAAYASALFADSAGATDHNWQAAAARNIYQEISKRGRKLAGGRSLTVIARHRTGTRSLEWELCGMAFRLQTFYRHRQIDCLVEMFCYSPRIQMGIVPARCIAAYYSLVVLQLSERFRCVIIYAFFYLVVPLSMRQNLLREFFGACMAGVAASAVFTLFILLVFALSILQFSSYLVRGRP
jgi:hypothetical protein